MTNNNPNPTNSCSLEVIEYAEEIGLYLDEVNEPKGVFFRPTANPFGDDGENPPHKSKIWVADMQQFYQNRQAYAQKYAENLVKEYIKFAYGKRCIISDLEDFPDTKKTDPGRCPTCVEYEIYDEWIEQRKLNQEKAGRIK